MKPKQRIALTVFASLAGISVLLLYTTLVQDILFKDTTFCTSSPLQLLFMSFGILASGALTGFLTVMLVLQDNYMPHVALSLVVIGKAFMAVPCEALGNPLWFEGLLNIALLFGLWIGYFLGTRFPLSPA
ncbi:MAG: hypothetical protein AAGF77_11090 [Bacteroidota bacterium]